MFFDFSNHAGAQVPIFTPKMKKIRLARPARLARRSTRKWDFRRRSRPRELAQRSQDDVSLNKLPQIRFMKSMGFDLQWVHMARYELTLRLEGALWLRIVFKPLLTRNWPIQIKKMSQKSWLGSRCNNLLTSSMSIADRRIYGPRHRWGWVLASSG